MHDKTAKKRLDFGERSIHNSTSVDKNNFFHSPTKVTHNETCVTTI